MSKKRVGFVISGMTYGQIFLLISSVFAFTFLISMEVEMVSADSHEELPETETDKVGKVASSGVESDVPVQDDLTGITDRSGKQGGPSPTSLAGAIPGFAAIAGGVGSTAGIKVIEYTNGARFAVTSGKIAPGETVKGFNLQTGEQGSTKLLADGSWKDGGLASNIEKQYGAVQIGAGNDVKSLAQIVKDGPSGYESSLKEAGWNVKVDGNEKILEKVSGSGEGSYYKYDSNGKLIAESTAQERGYLFFKSADPLYGRLFQGLGWAIAAAGVIQLVGSVAGLDQGLTNALTYAAAGGIMIGQLTSGLLDKYAQIGAKSAGQWGFGVGLAAAALIFILTYEEKSQEIVAFSCLPFEPPLGGQKCEECNKDPFRPCSEYRCKSLGQACQLLNAGTPNSKCAWVNPKDVVSPTITPWNAALYPSDLRFITDTSVRPPALGVKIVSAAGGCLPAFTPLEFGLTTNEPAQCKIDYNHTKTYESMQFLFGESNYYEYNHTQKMRLPGPDSPEVAGSPLFKNDGTFSLFVRCRDANGNENVDEYSVSFCVEKGPDTTPPIIESSSITSGSPVQYNIDKVPIEVYVNEPAQCKWSRESKAYSDMENTMSCATSANEINADLLYTCSGNLTAIKDREDNTFYFRCKDTNNNEMVQSYPLVLKGSQPLLINSIRPNETIFGSNTVVPISLEVVTEDGAEEGKAICFFSNSSNINSFTTKFFETNNYIHKQSLTLLPAQYTLYTRCVDAGGNIANRSTTFSVFVDNSAPKITRTYKQLGGLKIVTDEDAQCAYSLSSCNYEFKDGINMVYSNPDIKNNHFAEIKLGTTYYIKCQDKYGNQPDNPNECSLVVGTKDLIPQAE